uniref:Uncharacterized protein n=1 Tax=Anopheles farauti TaxID=69004 RepID=A0A182QBI2_9DIPT
MEPSPESEAKDIIAKYMSNCSISSSIDGSFNDRERLAELHKQVELKKAYRDDIRRLNSGLYALKQGMLSRSDKDEIADQLAGELNVAIRQLAEAQHETPGGLDRQSFEQKILGNSHQYLVEQMELQKLQSVVRLQDQLRAKLLGTRIVKQLEREQAAVASEEKELTKLEVISNQAMQKREEMFHRKRREIADSLIQIGEAMVQVKELRQKLAEGSKDQHRNELHDEQGSDYDLRNEEGRKDNLGAVGENVKGTFASEPLFESIDWNFSSVSMDCQLNLNFKNPNDFPDILTHLSSMNTGKLKLKRDKPQTLNVQSDQKVCKRKGTPIKVPKNVEGTKDSPQGGLDGTKVAKKPKKSDKDEDIIEIHPDEVENVPSKKNRKIDKQDGSNVGRVAPKQVLQVAVDNIPKAKATTAATENQRPRRHSGTLIVAHAKSPSPIGAKKTSPKLEKKRASTIFGESIKKDEKGAVNSAVKQTKVNQTKESQSTNQQSPPTPPVIAAGRQQKSNASRQRNLPGILKRNRSSEMLSPVGATSSKATRSASIVAAKRVEPTAMQQDDTEDMEASASNSSLDFAMQSSSGELDINLSGEFQLPEAGGMNDDGIGDDEDELDFLSASPRKNRKDKANGERKSKSADADGSANMDSFGFDFEGSNSSENMDQQDDLF